MDLSERATRTEREVRTFDVELRAVAEGRTVEGLAAPFNAPATIRDAFGEFTETLLPGAFTRTIQDRAGKIKLLAMHDRQSFPLGNIPRMWEDTDGLRIEAQIANTTAGTDALTLVNERVATGLSIGFQVVAGGQSWNDDFTERQLSEVKLLEVSLVHEPAYAEAGVTGVRQVDGMNVADIADAIAAIRADDYTDDHVALVTRALSSFEDALASLVPPTVPESIMADLAALYGKQPF